MTRRKPCRHEEVFDGTVTPHDSGVGLRCSCPGDGVPEVNSSNLALALLFWQWRPMGGVVRQVHSAVGQAAVWSLFALGWLTAFWATPTMTAAHFLFALGMTVDILIAIRFAERDLMHTVRLVATKSEDCGSCVQIAVNLARKDGVKADLLRSLLHDEVAALPYDVALAYGFAKSVVANDGEDEAYREELRKRFGEAVVIELSLAIAMSRVFLTLKRGMGYATSCQLATVEVEDAPGAVRR